MDFDKGFRFTWSHSGDKKFNRKSVLNVLEWSANSTFVDEEGVILSLGPYEWENFADNTSFEDDSEEIDLASAMIKQKSPLKKRLDQLCMFVVIKF